ncbi:uncharacterized protein LOC124353530 [Homalodisca vitripennis]|uniref:uncharacterized protein LOC124353530 n=1 Tax=Homalodisca vitripennis TaxID=197043 RepID=UPI001EEA7C94|nr:uncharacterized protein LOC124353530 [Homalodisca vitripennis]
MPQVDWSLHFQPPGNAAVESMFDVINFLSLRQHNTILNSRGVLLDLVFSTDEGINITAASDPILYEEAFHPALEFVLLFGCSGVDNCDVVFHDLRQSTIDNVRAWLASLNYPDPSCLDIEASFNRFCLNMGSSIKTNSPVRRKNGSTYPRWVTRELRQLISQKKLLNRNYKTSLLDCDYEAFRVVRRQCKTLSNACQQEFFVTINNSIKENPRSFWGHMKSLSKANTVPSRLQYGLVLAYEPQGMCDLFSDYFSTVYTPHADCHTDYNYESNINVSSCLFSATEIERKLQDLDASKGPGPDGITPAVVKPCSDLLAPHLAVYLNRLLHDGSFPNSLKPGYLVPVHKSGSTSKVTNYRPIVIQSVFAKIFESLILDVLSFKFKSVFIPQQHGFRPGKSTTTNLCVFTLDRSQNAPRALCDPSKALKTCVTNSNTAI